MRFPRWAYWGSLLVWLTTVAVTWAVYPLLPEPMAVHWNMAGEPDGFMPRLWAVGLLPATMLFLAGLLLVLVPRLEPWPRNVAAFGREYAAFAVGMLVFLAVVQGGILAWGLGWRGDMRRLLAMLLTALSGGLAWVLPRTRPNWFFGVRTPWTLADPAVWKATHEAARPVFGVVAGLSALAVLWPDWLLVVLIGLLGGALGLVIHSWRLYQERRGAMGGAS